MTTFNFIYLLKAWFPNAVILEIRALTCGFGVGSHNSDIPMFNILVIYFIVINLGMGLPGWLSGKEFACEAEDSGDTADSIAGLDRSPGGGHDNPLQYSWVENPMAEESGRLHSIWSLRGRHDWSNWVHPWSILIPIICRESRSHSVVHNYYNNGTIHVCVFIHQLTLSTNIFRSLFYIYET